MQNGGFYARICAMPNSTASFSKLNKREVKFVKDTYRDFQHDKELRAATLFSEVEARRRKQRQFAAKNGRSNDSILFHSNSTALDNIQLDVVINNFFEQIQKTHIDRVKSNPQVLDRIKDFYHKRHGISKRGFLLALKNLTGDNNPHGIVVDMDLSRFDMTTKEEDITLSPSLELAYTRFKEIHNQSLDIWIDYLTGEETKDYPVWAKYWVFRGVTSLGKNYVTK